MDEKTIIVGTPARRTTLLFIGIIIFAIGLLLYIMNFHECKIAREEAYILFDVMAFKCYDPVPPLFLDIGFLITIIGGTIYWFLCDVEIIVTNKRIYGTTTWGQEVEIPIDAIFAVSTTTMNAITIKLSNRFIKFKAIKNYEQVCSEIHKLLNATK